MADKKHQWLPLESNPEVLNKFAEKIGVPTDQWSFCDVYGVDPDLLMMIPKPVLAVLLLFPITDKKEADDALEKENIEKQGQTVSPSLWYMKQTIGNACGTIGVIHSLVNNSAALGLKADSHIAKFIELTKSLSPDQRAKALEDFEAFAAVHQDSANEGQTRPPGEDEDVNLHFIAFVNKDGNLYELDGRKAFPINHGATSADTLLEDSIAVIKKFMARDPNEVNFSMLALTKGETD